MSRIKRFFRVEHGASLVEYGLLISLVAIVAMAGASLLGSQANTLFSNVANTL